MRFLISILLLTSLLFGYQKGDTLNKEVQNKLNIKEGKIYIIDFFASWCSSCKREMPYLSKVNDAIDKEKIEIIGVDVDEDINKAKEFQDELKKDKALNFRVVNDPKNEIIKLFNPIGMPALFIVKNNKVKSLILGAKDEIDKIILDELKGLQ